MALIDTLGKGCRVVCDFCDYAETFTVTFELFDRAGAKGIGGDQLYRDLFEQGCGGELGDGDRLAASD